MKEEVSYLTPKQAGDLAGYTARHMLNIIKSGKLSATREDGCYYIEKSEFFRVFPDAHRENQRRNDRNVTEDQARIEAEIENRFLKESLADKERQNDYLKEQLENFTREKAQMLEAINSHSRLLEHKEATKAPSTKAEKGFLDLFKRS